MSLGEFLKNVAITKLARLSQVYAAISEQIQPEPKPSGNALISGGGVVATGNLNIRVSAVVGQIQGTQYSAAQTDLAVGAADLSNPRLDVVALKTDSTVVVVAGTASANPAKPVLDPTIYLELSSILVPAAASSLTVTNESIYEENTEWTTTSSGSGWVLGSSNFPFAGTKCIEASAVAANAYVQFADSADNDLANYNSLVLHIRSKAPWATQKVVTMQFYDSSDKIVGVSVTLKDGAFGFLSTSTSSYQQIVIPASVFQANGKSARKLRFSVAGGGAGIGFYLDKVFLQSGVSMTRESSPYMRWQGTYSATKAYEPNDVVVDTAQTMWVAVSANIGSAPSFTSTVWQVMKRTVDVWAIACSDLTTALTTGTGKAAFFAPYAARVLEVGAGLDTPQASGSIFTVDLNEAGTSILSTKLTIDNTESHSTTAATPAVISDALIAKGAKISVDIDQTGDGSAKGLQVYLTVIPQ